MDGLRIVECLLSQRGTPQVFLMVTPTKRMLFDRLVLIGNVPSRLVMEDVLPLHYAKAGQTRNHAVECCLQWRDSHSNTTQVKSEYCQHEQHEQRTVQTSTESDGFPALPLTRAGQPHMHNEVQDAWIEDQMFIVPKSSMTTWSSTVLIMMLASPCRSGTTNGPRTNNNQDSTTVSTKQCPTTTRTSIDLWTLLRRSSLQREPRFPRLTSAPLLHPAILHPPSCKRVYREMGKQTD